MNNKYLKMIMVVMIMLVLAKVNNSNIAAVSLNETNLTNEFSEPATIEKTSESNENITFNNNVKSKNILTKSEEFIIKDVVLRTVVNKRLGKSGVLLETYSATLQELETITMLDVFAATNVPKNILKIDTLEGIEKLVNLERLNLYSVIIPEEGLKDIAKLTKLKYLNFNTVIFSGDGQFTTQRLSSQINSGVVEPTLLIPFDNNIDLSPLASLSNLEELYVSITGTKEVAAYAHAPRTHFITSNLSKLTKLKTLLFDQMASVDDPTFSFLSSLTELERVSLKTVPINDVKTISNLPKINNLVLDETNVVDFTPIMNKTYFTGAKNLVNKIKTQYYTIEDVNGESFKKVTLNTGIKPDGDISAVTFSTISAFVGAFSVDEYRIVDGEIIIDFLVKNTLPFKKYNWQTGISDIDYNGIVFGINFTSANNKKITYTSNAFNIGKIVSFDLNYPGSTNLTKYFDPLEKIKAPTTLEVSRDKYSFKGWYTDQLTQNEFDFNTDTIENLTLYVKWEAKKYHKVNFVTNGSTKPILEQTVEDKTKITKPTNPIRQGYTFDGWYSDEKLSILWSFDNDIVEQDLTLYAKWKKQDNSPAKTEEVDNDKKEYNDIPKTGVELQALYIMFMLTSITYLLYRKQQL